MRMNFAADSIVTSIYMNVEFLSEIQIHNHHAIKAAVRALPHFSTYAITLQVLTVLVAYMV